jgi:hypothetical protein
MKLLLALLALFLTPQAPVKPAVTFKGPVTFTVTHVAESGAIQTFGGSVIVNDISAPVSKRVAIMQIETVKTCETAGSPPGCTPGSTMPNVLVLPLQVTDTSGKTTYFSYQFVLVTDNASPVTRQTQPLFGAFAAGVMPISANVTLLLGNTPNAQGLLDILEWNGFKWTPGTMY